MSEVYAVNAETMGIVRYPGWEDAHVLIEHDGMTLLVADDGLYEHGGSDDAGTGVAWKIRTGSMRLNGRKQYNLFQLNPVLRAASNVSVNLIAEFQGREKTIGPFTIRIPVRDRIRAWPKLLGEGHEPVSYQVELSGTGPAEMRSLSALIRPINNTWRSR